MAFIKQLSGIGKQDVGIVGGKAASLGELIKAGIPVPPGFVILANAFDRFIQKTGLAAEIEAALDSVNPDAVHTVEEASEKIKAIILEKEMPDNIAAAIINQSNALNAPFVAVRSSATAEDSARAAWAGQLETYLNTTKETLLENVKNCWASLFTPRAIFYRFEKGLQKEAISVAVVVQTMVQSEVSGVAFSVHPVTQDKNQLIIEACYGLGEALVSGQLTPDSYVVEKNKLLIIGSSISKQEKMLAKKAGGGDEWVAVPNAKKEKQKLNKEQIIGLAKLVSKIEKHYSFPVDVEWAIEKGVVYVTQSRAITTL